jgi:tRNA(Ile)-lysidine synthase TilS/MesJ/uncharacterized protein (DUF924 family)
MDLFIKFWFDNYKKWFSARQDWDNLLVTRWGDLFKQSLKEINHTINIDKCIFLDQLSRNFIRISYIDNNEFKIANQYNDKLDIEILNNAIKDKSTTESLLYKLAFVLILRHRKTLDACTLALSITESLMHHDLLSSFIAKIHFASIRDYEFASMDAKYSGSSNSGSSNSGSNSGISSGGCKYLISVSGGVDSISLLHRMANKFPVIAVHIHYNNRGADADEECQVCVDACKSSGVPLLVHKISSITREQAGKYRELYESTTKEIRFGAYVYWWKKHNGGDICHVMLGHHIDDVVENIFMNISNRRGGIDGAKVEYSSVSKGLLGMQSVSEPILVSTSKYKYVPVVIERPFIADNLRKQDIVNYAVKYKLKFVAEDLTKKHSERAIFRKSLLQPLDKYISGLVNYVQHMVEVENRLQLLEENQLANPLRIISRVTIFEHKSYMPRQHEAVEFCPSLFEKFTQSIAISLIRKLNISTKYPTNAACNHCRLVYSRGSLNNWTKKYKSISLQLTDNFVIGFTMTDKLRSYVYY